MCPNSWNWVQKMDDVNGTYMSKGVGSLGKVLALNYLCVSLSLLFLENPADIFFASLGMHITATLTKDKTSGQWKCVSENKTIHHLVVF